MSAGRPLVRRSIVATVCVATALVTGPLAVTASAADGRAPETPSDLRIVAGSLSTCATDSVPAVRSTTPTLRARVSDPDPGNVAATFTVLDGTTDAVVWGPHTTLPEMSGSDQALQVPEDVLADEGTYRWTVSAVDADGNRSAEASCRFTVDLVAPDLPTVTPVAGRPAVYVEDAASGDIGVEGSFTFGVPDLPSSADVVEYRYSFDSQALAASVDAGSPTISFVPTTSTHTLYVQAVDAAGWTSPLRTYRFRVGAVAPAPDGSFGGVVTNPSGELLAGVRVDARNVSTGAVGSTTTTADGRYTVDGLLAGQYVVAFVPPTDATPRYTPEYWDDATSEDLATPVTIYRGRRTSGISPVLAPVPVEFVDVAPDAPFATEITWLREAGISTGTVRPDGTRVFDPAGPVRREAMAAFLYRAAGSPEFTPPAESPFVDVPAGGAFYAEITWLHAQGITTGTTTQDGLEFQPAEAVSREAMAAFLYRRAGSPGSSDAPPFTDVAEDHPFATEISWLAGSGISTGTDMGDGTFEFRPSESVRREAMAAFLYRAR